MNKIKSGKHNNKRLMLLFYIGNKRYALDAANVEEIIPLVKIEEITEDNEKLAGHINYRGRMIPVIDMARHLHGRPSRKMLSTRIMIMNPGDKSEIFGIIAEKVTETQYVEDSSIEHPLLEDPQQKLNGILLEKEGIVRNMKLEYLLKSVNKALPERSENKDDDK